jgi:predicted MFS family arabinose efflux permease
MPRTDRTNTLTSQSHPPPLGGLLTSAFSWRAVFLPNVPLGVLALILAFLMMPEVTSHRKRRLTMMSRSPDRAWCA